MKNMMKVFNKTKKRTEKVQCRIKRGDCDINKVSGHV